MTTLAASRDSVDMLMTAIVDALMGPSGVQGDKGDDGKDGVDGADSTIPGPRGHKGDKGDTGDKGERGERGFGAVGRQGPPGLPGGGSGTGCGLPPGGAPGQVVTNIAPGAGDWQDPTGGGSSSAADITVAAPLTHGNVQAELEATAASEPNIVRADRPTEEGSNAFFELYASSPVSSGTYKLAFLGFTTDPIDGTTGTMTDIADAMNAAYGDTIAQAFPGDESKTPNNDAEVQFIGALGLTDMGDGPTVVDDTTDGGIVTGVPRGGGGTAPDPIGVIGQSYYASTDGALFERTSAGWVQILPLPPVIEHGVPVGAATTELFWIDANSGYLYVWGGLRWNGPFAPGIVTWAPTSRYRATASAEFISRVTPRAPNGYTYRLVAGKSGSDEPRPLGPTTNPDGALQWSAGSNNGYNWGPLLVIDSGRYYFPATSNTHYYHAGGPGTTGATEPAWPTNGGTVVDGDITWTDVGSGGGGGNAESLWASETMFYIDKPDDHIAVNVLQTTYANAGGVNTDGTLYGVDGFSGGGEPAWPTVPDEEVVDGDLTWRCEAPVMPGSTQTYTASNVSPDRSYDANSTTLDELADVLGTLIDDLRARRIVN